MKTFKICCLFTFICLFLPSFTEAQDKQLNDFLAKFDTSAIKNKALFNKAVFTTQLLEILRSKEKDANGLPIMTITTSQFKTFTNIVANADLNSKPKPKAMAALFNQTRNQLTASNIVPIGIINAEATFLTQQQIDENVKAKAENKQVISDSYEIIPIKMVGLLQDEIFQDNVSFQISPDLVQSNVDNPITKIEIDFQDGKGWQAYKLQNQLIPHTFNSIGIVAVSIKITTKQSTFITYCPLKINLLERPTAYKTGTVSVDKIRLEEVKTNSTLSTVTGGEYAIYTGCDGVLDKPIIIAEGFDANQDVNIDFMVGKYYPYLYALRNNGYDLVFVNYTDGRDYIENNAEVLKIVINQVNSLKTGNEKLTIVGESMSGLVARYALKTMENAGQTHNVGHFISFDSPQKGANVPSGLVAMRRWATFAAFPISLIIDELNNLFNFVPILTALDSPAARQMLVTQNIDSPHSDFYAFQNTLNNLGYPSQNGIRNVALLNGALNGKYQSKYHFDNGLLIDDGTLLQPSDKILEAQYFYILANLSVNVWTNEVNQSTKVFEGFSLLLIPPSLPSYDRTNVTFSKNLDRLAGGQIYNGFGNIPLNFSFVPTFSSIDYKGSLNTDTDYTFSIRNFINGSYQVTNTSLTPFVAIYGSDNNTIHSYPKNQKNVWNDLAKYEFGILDPNSVLTSCVATLPIPTGVYKTSILAGCHVRIPRDEDGCAYQTYYEPFPSTICSGARINYYYGGTGGNYQINTIDEFIRITGNNGGVWTYDIGRGSISFANYTNGTYTISTIIRYANGLSRYQISSDEKSYSSVFSISGGCFVATCGLNDGDLAAYIAEYDAPAIALATNNGSGMWYAMLQDGTFISKSTLIANGLDANSASCFIDKIETIQNGNWNVASTWNTNFVPRFSDDITIKAGHRVILTPAMGIQKCGKSCVENGSIFDCTGTLLMDAH